MLATAAPHRPPGTSLFGMRLAFPTPARAAGPLAAAAVAVWVYQRALGTFFSQDDFLGLARASGLAPRLTGPWRFLSHQVFFDLMRPLAGLNAVPYQVVSLVAHATCAALLAVFLARRVSPPAALVGAAFFAAHPALFDAIYWISATGESLAALLALAALMTALRADRWRWWSLPLFALSLTAKESTWFLPVVVALAGRGRRAAGGPRPLGVTVGLGVVAIAYAVAFAAGNAFGLRGGLSATAPYAAGVGPHLGANALTYLGWTSAFALPAVRGFGDAVDPAVYPWAVGTLLLWLAGLASRRLRKGGWMVGGAMWLAFLLPVLPLRNHTYHYYLYAPLLGAAWCLAAAADAVLSPRAARRREPGGRRRAGRARRVWVVSGAAAALLTLNGWLLVRKIETMPFVLPELRSQPVIDRARIARRVQEDLAQAALPPGSTLRFWSPTASALGPRGEPLASPSPRETYWERNVREALLDGLAVRVMLPQVESVRFVREFEPAGPADWYAVYRPDGHLRVASATEVEAVLGEQAMP